MSFAWTQAAPLCAVMDALGARGEARFVGGCVRDSLIGLAPAPLDPDAGGTTDIDVATTLTPDEITAALTAAGLAAYPTGIEHGTVTAVSDGLPVEVTTLRADVATDGRHAEVRFTTDWDEDWRRRDFTVNAMYLGADGQLYDPAGGQADLAARRVRFIGDPDERIIEDYLRILRFFRFTSRYADAPDAAGLAACARGADGLGRLSKERVWQETAKLFATPRAPQVLAAADGAGVLTRVLDAEPDHAAFARLHELLGADVPPSLGLEALWPRADTLAFKAAFKPANDTLDRVEAARMVGARLTPDQGVPLLRALYRFGARAVTDAALLAAARAEAAGHAPQPWLDLHARADRVPVPVLPVQGRDLVARGLAPGPKIGAALTKVEADWLSAGCPSDPGTVEALIARATRG